MKWVPISFCQLCLELKLENAGKLFCFLKHETDGIIALPKALWLSKNYFGVSERTIRRWLNQAIDNNWIGFNTKTKFLFIRSWQHLFNQYMFPKRASFRFSENDLKDFKTFCFAVIIQYLSNRVQDETQERLWGCYKKKRSIQASSWSPVAISGISRIVNLPESTVQKYRNRSHNKGLIIKRSRLKKTTIKVNELIWMRKFEPESTRKFIIRNNQVFIQLPDEVKIDTSQIHSPKRFYLTPKSPLISP